MYCLENFIGYTTSWQILGKLLDLYQQGNQCARPAVQLPGVKHIGSKSVPLLRTHMFIPTAQVSLDNKLRYDTATAVDKTDKTEIKATSYKVQMNYGLLAL